MRIVFLSICMGLSLIAAKAQTVPELYRKADQQKMTHWADSVFDTLSFDERIGQLFMVVADPSTDSRNMQKLMRFVNEVKIGGILFHKGDPISQAEVTNRIQKASRVPLLVSLDGEWGLSMRLSGTTRFPKNMMLGAIENNDLLELYGEEVARQCKELGIHINFAPDLDVNSNAANPVIGIRSFGEEPYAVAEKGIAYSRGLEKGGVISVAKHFPGHGDTADDSHYTLPSVRHDIRRLDSVELLPFKYYIAEGFAGMMTGHLYVPALDNTPNRPASLSRAVVTNLLQNNLGFTGLTFTDALVMKGAATSGKNACVLALQAGNDVLLSPGSPFTDFAAVKKAVEDGVLDRQEIEQKCLKILQYKYIAGLHDYQPIAIEGLSNRLNTPHAAWLVAKLNAEAITVVKNEEELIPLKQLDEKKIAVVSLGDVAGNEFQSTMKKFASVSTFTIARNATAAQIQQVYNQLNGYDVILVGVHTSRIPESEQLRQLAAKKEVILTFFTLPYTCKQYTRSIEQAKGVVLAYEATPLAMNYAAQVVFGGIGAAGKLPAGIPGLYFAGSGIFTDKTRLGYHEPEEVGLNPDRLQMVDSIAMEGLRAGAYPGCQVLVARNGMIVYNKGFGYYDATKRQQVTPESVYDLASVSKAVGTLLAVMKSYDQDHFTLNSKISEYIPYFKGSDKENLTIRELLYHQSGVTPTINFYLKTINKDSYQGSMYSSVKNATHPVRFDAKTWVRNDFTFKPELVSRTSKPGFTTQVARNFYLNTTFQDTIMQEIRDSKVTNRGKYKYSCINFIILQKMIENQLQQPLDQIFYSQFTDRLGASTLRYNPTHFMDSSRIVPTEDDQFIRRQLLRGYVHDEAAAFQGGVSGNAGLFSTANDLAKPLQLYLNQGIYGGEEYLSPETCRLFTQNKSPNSRRGLGFDKPVIGNPKASPCGILAPPSVYGHTGYTGTCFWVDPDNQLIYIFLSNRVYPNRSNNKLGSMEIRPRIQDAIYKAIDINNEKD